MEISSGGGEIISLFMAASLIAERSRTVEGALSRQALHARQVADHVQGMADADLPSETVTPEEQSATHIPIDPDEWDPRGLRHLEDAPAWTVWPSPSLYEEARRIARAFEQAPPAEKGAMVLRAARAKKESDGWLMPNGSRVKDDEVQLYATDLSLIKTIRFTDFGTEWFSVGWEPEGASASLSYLGDDYQSIEVRVRYCDGVVEAWCLIVILNDFALRHGIARQTRLTRAWISDL